MAKLALIYGMRLLPSDEIEQVTEAEVRLKSGKTAHVAMHLIEGASRDSGSTGAVSGRVLRVLPGDLRLISSDHLPDAFQFAVEPAFPHRQQHHVDHDDQPRGRQAVKHVSKLRVSIRSGPCQ